MAWVPAAITAGAALGGAGLDQGAFQPKQRQQAKEDFAWERGTAGKAQAASINDALSMLLGPQSGLGPQSSMNAFGGAMGMGGGGDELTSPGFNPSGGGGMLGEANRGIRGEMEAGQGRLLDFDHSGLKAVASRNFSQNSAAARAALGSSGLRNSGAANASLAGAYSGAMTDMSQAMSDDMFRRQSAASQIGMQGSQAMGANSMSAALAALAAKQDSAFGDAAFAEEIPNIEDEKRRRQMEAAKHMRGSK